MSWFPAQVTLKVLFVREDQVLSPATAMQNTFYSAQAVSARSQGEPGRQRRLAEQNSGCWAQLKHEYKCPISLYPCFSYSEWVYKHVPAIFKNVQALFKRCVINLMFNFMFSDILKDKKIHPENRNEPKPTVKKIDTTTTTSTVKSSSKHSVTGNGSSPALSPSLAVLAALAALWHYPL